jgi:hypothetical protein
MMVVGKNDFENTLLLFLYIRLIVFSTPLIIIIYSVCVDQEWSAAWIPRDQRRNPCGPEWFPVFVLAEYKGAEESYSGQPAQTV